MDHASLAHVSSLSPFPGALPARLSSQSIALLEKDLACDYLLDEIVPGNPLVISFNYFTQLEYDFFGRLRKLEETLGTQFNRIMLRDRHHAWYQRGVFGLGDSVDAVAAALRPIIATMRPSKIITIGQSMGAYAAVLFGMLLDADKVIAYGPLSYIRHDWIARDNDIRWLSLFKLLADDRPEKCYDDLLALAATRASLPVMEILTGTNPDGTGGIANMDLLHARRFATLPQVRSLEYPESRHEIVIWLKEHKLIDTLLYDMIAPLCTPGDGVSSCQVRSENQLCQGSIRHVS
ncbi:MAG: alpha/beta hydrolase family protein [Janthinobacterium lividum]